MKLDKKFFRNVLYAFAKKNNEFLKMKEKKLEKNMILGRTMSLGQYFGYYFGAELAKRIKKYVVLVDMAVTELEKNIGKKRRKTLCPDIMILKKIQAAKNSLYNKIIKSNKKELGKLYKSQRNPKGKIEAFNLYQVKAIIELKIDPGYLPDEDNKAGLFKSFDIWSESQRKGYKFSFTRVITFDESEINKYYLKDVVVFDRGVAVDKHLIFGCFKNHSERLEWIRPLCREKKINPNSPFSIIDLKTEKHIRELRSKQDVDKLVKKEMLHVNIK